MKNYFIVFICSLIVPLIMLICGYFLWKFPPKKRNSFIGYRTSSSMRSDESWAFAQKYCGRIWLWSGFGMLLLTAILLILLPDKSDAALKSASLVVMPVQIVLMLLTIIPVEVMLKKKFGEDSEEK